VDRQHLGKIWSGVPALACVLAGLAASLSMASTEPLYEYAQILTERERQYGGHMGQVADGDWLAVPAWASSRLYMYRRDDAGRWARHSIIGRPASLSNDWGVFPMRIWLKEDRMLLGEPGAPVGGQGFRGQAWMYEYHPDEDKWLLAHEFSPTDSEPIRSFGGAISMRGENQALIGASGAGDDRTGKVYVFSRAGSGAAWVQSTVIEPPAADVEAGLVGSFGSPLVVSGDVAVIVDRLGTVGDHVSAGRVYIYRDVDGQWTLEQTLLPEAPRENGNFGERIDYSFDRLLLSQGRVSGTEGEHGVSYLYRHDGEQWVLQQALAPTRHRDRAATDAFVAQAENRIAFAEGFHVIGIDEPDLRADTSVWGAIHLFSRDDDTGLWEPDSILAPPMPGRSGDTSFGNVSFAGDQLIVRAGFNRQGNSPYVGAVYVFEPGEGPVVQLHAALEVSPGTIDPGESAVFHATVTHERVTDRPALETATGVRLIAVIPYDMVFEGASDSACEVQPSPIPGIDKRDEVVCLIGELEAGAEWSAELSFRVDGPGWSWPGPNNVLFVSAWADQPLPDMTLNHAVAAVRFFVPDEDEEDDSTGPPTSSGGGCALAPTTAAADPVMFLLVVLALILLLARRTSTAAFQRNVTRFLPVISAGCSRPIR
jgi:hypothetical protein